nr:MAG: RNA-dependent RNA polymerase [Leptosphaeria biglobosa botourmiavirus 1]
MSNGCKRKTARCIAGSLGKALEKCIHVICLEFRLPGDIVSLGDGDCISLREGWKEGAAKIRARLPRLRAKRLEIFEALVKSVNRVFDAECQKCDEKLAAKARLAWQQDVSRQVVMPSVDWCHDPIWLLKRRVRELTVGWGHRLVSARKRKWGEGEWTAGEGFKGYVPDQQGCLELTKLEGGTLAVADEDLDPRDSVVRVGVAKTKGKFRTVTMQGARVKRTLRPVHEALYDHLTSFAWCVRGEVTREHLQAVADDRRPGEKLISGDYQAATNNIYLEAVEAIVGVLAEDPELSEEERSTLLGSFSGISWVSRNGTLRPICRGSMMGNLVSFPLLCLLNKACFDIACDVTQGEERRIGRFNGDDCAFSGTDQFYQFWRTVTGTFGLIVNEEKTGVSSSKLELNSHSYFVGARGLNPKPVISFFRPNRKESGELITEVYKGIRQLRPAVREWVWNVGMRHEIAIRPIEVANIPRRTANDLFRRKWFRRALHDGPAPVEKYGVERKIPMVVANPPVSNIYQSVTRMSDKMTMEYVEYWQGRSLVAPSGVPGHCYSEQIDRKTYYRALRSKRKKSPPHWILRQGKTRWRFCWVRPVYEFFEQNYPELILTDNECNVDWIDDHPYLSTTKGIDRVRRVDLPCFPPVLPETIPTLFEHGTVLVCTGGHENGVVRRGELALPYFVNG